MLWSPHPLGVLMNSTVVDDTSRLVRLLAEFERVRGPSASPPTFFEITQYPHFENVASNVLAFFLDPDGEHGLGSLFLDSLLAPLELERLSFRSVEREAGTENGKRLDLIIECEEHVIGVENKIYAGTHNPFNDYLAHLQERSEGRQAELILLCLQGPPAGTLPEGVAVVTYEELMGRVRQGLGLVAGNAPAQYLTFALEFVKTMENLKRGSRMNEGVMELFREREDDVKEFLYAARKVRDELRGLVQRTAEMVNDRFPGQMPQQVRQWFYREERNLVDDLVHDVEFPSGSKVAIDAYLGMQGWQVQVWQRRSAGDKVFAPELIVWLRSLGVAFRVPDDRLDAGRRVTVADFEFDALEDVAAYLAELVARIASADAGPGEQAPTPMA